MKTFIKLSVYIHGSDLEIKWININKIVTIEPYVIYKDDNSEVDGSGIYIEGSINFLTVLESPDKVMKLIEDVDKS